MPDPIPLRRGRLGAYAIPRIDEVKSVEFRPHQDPQLSELALLYVSSDAGLCRLPMDPATAIEVIAYLQGALGSR